MVRKGGLEPPRVLPHQILNLHPVIGDIYRYLTKNQTLTPESSPLLEVVSDDTYKVSNVAITLRQFYRQSIQLRAVYLCSSKVDGCVPDSSLERHLPALSRRGGLVRYLQRLSGTEPLSCWRRWSGLNTPTARGLGKGVVRERKAERTPSGVATRRKATAD